MGVVPWAVEFTAYSPSHLVVLALFAVGTVVLLAVGPRWRGSPAEQPVGLGLAWGNLVFGVLSSISALMPFTVRHSLPLQICDLAWIVVAWALFTRHPMASALTYYWGLTLSVQALLQPTLTTPYPHLEFFAFWGKHLLIVWGAIYFSLVLRNGADWAAYRRAVGWTLVWLVVVLCLNAALGSNYGYVNGKPSEATILDVLGPWPLYLLAEMAIIMTGWALITIPWTGLPRRQARVSGSRRPLS
jgi:hypothetical integral membrane protein (TIGR02206 family)